MFAHLLRSEQTEFEILKLDKGKSEIMTVSALKEVFLCELNKSDLEETVMHLISLIFGFQLPKLFMFKVLTGQS